MLNDFSYSCIFWVGGSLSVEGVVWAKSRDVTPVGRNTVHTTVSKPCGFWRAIVAAGKLIETGKY